CGGACVDMQTDPNNCGSCGTGCASPNLYCVSGQCRYCQAGLTQCGSLCVNTDSDPGNCGSCGQQCPTGETGVNGHCTCGNLGDCRAGEVCCGGASPICANIGDDVNNCGACGNVCRTPANATAVCNSGSCGYVCNSGFADCNGSASDGCETDLSTISN